MPAAENVNDRSLKLFDHGVKGLGACPVSCSQLQSFIRALNMSSSKVLHDHPTQQ